MTGTKQNAACLYGDLMKAVARILHEDQALMRRPSLVSDFDAMDLAGIRKQAQAMKCGVPLTERAGVLISLQLADTPLAAAA
ncbi:hypothetical protein [Agrobacterium tumefaciens]|uniref:hypothetical protein n=1 Tax=Agrobacterium tumefaciens TaxID=358 RepID=UPI00117759D4|nr:hypothetical protein [Agrobacterium tumefaciens]